MLHARLSLDRHNSPRDMKWLDLQFQMHHRRLREVKGLAQGHTAEKLPDRDSDCKLHALGVPCHPQVKERRFYKLAENSDFPRRDPNLWLPSPRPHQGHRQEHLQKTQEPTETVERSPRLGEHAGLCTQTAERVQEPKSQSTRPGRQYMTL